jgi:hypothetical protein
LSASTGLSYEDQCCPR